MLLGVIRARHGEDAAEAWIWRGRIGIIEESCYSHRPKAERLEGLKDTGWKPVPRGTKPAGNPCHLDGANAMHFDAHQPIINDLEARISTIRDSL